MRMNPAGLLVGATHDRSLFGGSAVQARKDSRITKASACPFGYGLNHTCKGQHTI